MERIVDAGDLRKYRTEIPNLVDDSDLSVYAFRLYVHLKRVAGQGGACWEGTRKLAERCHMSVSKVSESKQELVAAGFITIQRRDNNQSDYIRIEDIWRENFESYTTDEVFPTRTKERT